MPLLLQNILVLFLLLLTLRCGLLLLPFILLYCFVRWFIVGFVLDYTLFIPYYYAILLPVLDICVCVFRYQWLLSCHCYTRCNVTLRPGCWALRYSVGLFLIVAFWIGVLHILCSLRCGWVRRYTVVSYSAFAYQFGCCAGFLMNVSRPHKTFQY